MYNSRNPVLRHFGADQLATLGTLQSIEDRRLRGEYVSPEEGYIARPTPEFNEYFEFDTPVASGLDPDARDMLIEEATLSPAPRSRAEAASVSYDQPSPGEYDRFGTPSASPGASSPGVYTSPEASYPDRGSGRSMSGGPSGSSSSPRYYDPRPQLQRRAYGAYSSRSGSPGSETSPRRSSGSPGRSPSSMSYDRGPTIQQPPFRAGAPATGRVRRPGMTAQAGGGAGARRRTTSSSADRSRSPQPSTTTSQPQSNEQEPAPSSSQPDQQTSEGDPDSGAGGARRRSTGPTASVAARRASLVARITGRPSSAVAGAGGGSGGGGGGGGGGVGGGPGRAARRPVSASPGAAGGGAVASRATARVPAWAPAAGIANMRLDDMDEATRVALMLNDPAVRQDAGQAPDQQQPQAGPSADVRVPAADQPPPTVSPGQSPPPAAARGSPGGSPEGDTRRPSDASERYYEQYRLRRHREAQGVPDYRYSQPRSHGAHAPVSQRYFSFDEAHPAIADKHYGRSTAQERMLQAERRKLEYERARAARAAARNRSTPPQLPTSQQLAADVDRLARVREAGRARLRELEQEGETLRQETREVQQRALDAIARSEHITAVTSRSPSASPPPRRSRSPSPSAYYSGLGGSSYSRGAFGPVPRVGYYGSRSPSVSPGRYRPASAAAAGTYGRGSPGQYAAGPYADMVGYYGDQAAAAAAAQAAAQAQYQAQYQAGVYYGAAGVQRPVLAPPGPGSPPHGPSEAQQILDMINSVERLPQHPQMPLDSGASDPSGDHLVRASAIAASRRPMGLLAADEQRIATGVYDRARYEEYQRQTDLEMQRRALQDGYDSDLDRDRAAGELVHDSQKVNAEEEARLRAREEYWAQENEWMDEYRQRFGPEDGYMLPPQSEAPSPRAGNMAAGRSLLPPQRSLSDTEEDMLQQPYVPLVSPELTLSPGGGYASEGPDAYHPHRRTRRRLFFKSTVPEPFQFEEREKMRPKPISKVKLEQDLALRRAEEEAARKHRFRASPVPPAVVEPRYERMLLEAEAKRQLSQQHRLEELASMLEQPFSFYYRDKEKKEEREALARAAKDPNRFQVAFKARDAPAAHREERFRAMMLELEARREASRTRVEEARRAAKERAVEDAQRRRAAADRAYHERLRAVDPALHPYPPKPLGVVPDFNALHRHFEVQMARNRANIRKRVTVPQEFKLNGSTPDEQAARARKAEERRQRIILDMQMDAELLPEDRWPHKSPRGKVRRTPPPAYLIEWMARSPGPTRADNARKSSNAVAAHGGAYLTRAEKEELDRKASEKLRAEALRRADRLLKAAQARREEERKAAGGEGGEGGDGGFGVLSDVGATAAGGADQGSSGPAARGAAVRRREAVAGRQDNPEVYVEARHAQIEKKAHEEVEDALLDQGIEAYRYVEGLDGAGKKKNNKKKDNNRAGSVGVAEDPAHLDDLVG